MSINILNTGVMARFGNKAKKEKPNLIFSIIYQMTVRRKDACVMF